MIVALVYLVQGLVTLTWMEETEQLVLVWWPEVMTWEMGGLG